MMTSKIEDRLRKNGVKIKKYYKWPRWSMIYKKTKCNKKTKNTQLLQSSVLQFKCTQNVLIIKQASKNALFKGFFYRILFELYISNSLLTDISVNNIFN